MVVAVVVLMTETQLDYKVVLVVAVLEAMALAVVFQEWELSN
jgi:hypothetical protein